MKKTIQHVSKLRAAPVKGKQYYVPCVEYGGFWVPIIGLPHDDKDLGQPKRHWHVDIRFITEKESVEVLEKPLEKFYPISGTFCPPPGVSQVNIGLAIIIACKGQKVRKEIRKCLRNIPDMRSNVPIGNLFNDKFVWHSGDSLDSYGKMEDQFANKKLSGACKKCPHRGTPLQSVSTIGGVITCPSHGLDFDAKSGCLIRRTELKNGRYQYKS